MLPKLRARDGAPRALLCCAESQSCRKGIGFALAADARWVDHSSKRQDLELQSLETQAQRNQGRFHTGR